MDCFNSYLKIHTIKAVMKLKELIGIRIKNLRKSRGMSQEQLAEKIGISPKYLSSIERGKENPTLDIFTKLAAALGVELSEIFNLSVEGKSVRDLKIFITNLMRGSDEEKLRLTAKIIRAIYL
jgi:transcriptional regulator with XRE-family HTH domain